MRNLSIIAPSPAIEPRDRYTHLNSSRLLNVVSFISSIIRVKRCFGLIVHDSLFWYNYGYKIFRTYKLQKTRYVKDIIYKSYTVTRTDILVNGSRFKFMPLENKVAYNYFCIIIFCVCGIQRLYREGGGDIKLVPAWIVLVRYSLPSILMIISCVCDESMIEVMF